MAAVALVAWALEAVALEAGAQAAVASRLCTTNVHCDGLTAHVACQLIPLNKKNRSHAHWYW